MTNVPAIEKWIDELLSGKYPQGKGVLRTWTTSENGKFEYCPLGVACEAAILDGVPVGAYPAKWANTTAYGSGPNEPDLTTGHLPRPVARWLDISENPHVILRDGRRKAIVAVNDHLNYPFEWIAGMIRRTYLEGQR